MNPLSSSSSADLDTPGPESRNNSLTVFTGTKFTSSIMTKKNSAEALQTVSKITSLSTSSIVSSAQNGVLSTTRQRQISQQTDDRLQIMSRNVGARVEKINEAINEFHRECEKIKVFVLERHRKLAEHLDSSEEVFENAFNRYGIVLDASAKTIQFITQAQEAVLKMNQRGLEIDASSTLDVVDMIFKARKEEISLYGSQLDLIERVEKHNFDLFMQTYEMQLKEQAQLFQQMKEVAEFQSRERELESERNLKVKAQAHQEAVDRRKLGIEERIAMKKLAQEEKKQEQNHAIEIGKLNLEDKKIELEQALKRNEQKIKAETERRQHELEADVERQRIAADERARVKEAHVEGEVGLAQAAASASRCAIM